MEKISNAWISVKDFMAKWWFLASSLVIAILYYVVRRQGTTIGDLHSQVQRAKLGEQLAVINAKETADEKSFKESRESYLALKRRHPEHFDDSSGPAA